MGYILDPQGQLSMLSVVKSKLAKFQLIMKNAWPRYLKDENGSDQKQPRKSGDIDVLDI